MFQYFFHTVKKNQETYPISNVLLYTDAVIIDNLECQRYYDSSTGYTVYPDNVCTFPSSTGRFCSADSGGPLFSSDGKTFFQVKLVYKIKI